MQTVISLLTVPFTMKKYRKKIIVTVSQTDVTVSVCHTDVTN